MRSVAARSSHPLKVEVADWLQGFLKLGDPDLASVFPACAGKGYIFQGILDCERSYFGSASDVRKR